LTTAFLLSRSGKGMRIATLVVNATQTTYVNTTMVTTTLGALVDSAPDSVAASDLER
jgi:hypothetical protein